MRNNCYCECEDVSDEEDCCPNWCEEQKVRGRFGIAFVTDTPCCCPEPMGWQVEFCDTPAKVEQKCKEMMQWVNCPPLPRCNPCPPNELCSPYCPPCPNPCTPITNPSMFWCPVRTPVCECCPPRSTLTKKCPCCCKGQIYVPNSKSRKNDYRNEKDDDDPTCPCCCGSGKYQKSDNKRPTGVSDDATSKESKLRRNEDVKPEPQMSRKKV